MRPFFLVFLIILIIPIFVSCDNEQCLVYFRGEGIKNQTLSFISQAQVSLDICVYSITDRQIIDELSKKANQGVQIRICTDNAYPLILPGVKIVYDSQGLMHNKYMIADSERVWFGSTNLTPTSLEDHENNVLISRDYTLIEAFQQNFEQCFSGLFKDSRRPLGKKMIRFSPEEDCFDFLLNELSRAEKSVYIAMYAFSDNRIAHYLKILSSKGVQISILVDKDWNMSSIYSDIDDMARYACVRLDTCDDLLHEKFVVIDEKVVMTGSYNYTASAQTRNDEFIYKTTDKSVVQQFTQHFLNLWKASGQR